MELQLHKLEHEKLDHATRDWDRLGFAEIAGINFYRDAVGARKRVQIQSDWDGEHVDFGNWAGARAWR